MSSAAAEVVTDDMDQETERAKDKRGHRRVGVALRAAVVLGRDKAFIASTVDMSEGGVLLDHYSGPNLRKGRLVGLNIRGVVSDQQDGDSDHFFMRVVRCDGERLALRFVEASDMQKKKLR